MLTQSHTSRQLDRTFAALADPGRRAMLGRLSAGPATVSELAEPLNMTLSAVLQHINYLEDTPDAVRARAQALAERIRDNAPLSVMAGKESILTAMSAGCDAGMALAHNIYRAAYASEDAQEGPRAFAEKRKPVWKGR